MMRQVSSMQTIEDKLRQREEVIRLNELDLKMLTYDHEFDSVV